jgi:hypothetical protein
MASPIVTGFKIAKKVIPKSKKGKVAAIGAAAVGINLKNKGNKPAVTAMTASQDAQNANAPAGEGTGKNNTLNNLPVGTQIKAGTTGFPGIPYRADYKGTSYTTSSALAGDAEKYFATQNAPEKAALLLRLGQIPNLYGTGMAPTAKYVADMGNRIIWRDADAKALEGVLRVQDQLGDATTNITLSNLISNPNLASKFFGKVSGTTKAVTPLSQIQADMDSTFLDLFESKADIGLVKAYAKEINALELSGTGASKQQKENILLKYIQKKADNVYSIGGVAATDKGALGRTVRDLRAAYEDNGIPFDDKQIYNKAVQSLRSPDAAKNILEDIGMHASIIMPAFKEFYARGKSAREVLSPYISVRSQILGIPEDQIRVKDMYEVGSGAVPLSLQEYKAQVYKSNEYKQSDNYKSVTLGDTTAMLRAFNLGA